MGRRGRVNGGRIEAWRAALAHLKEHRGLVAQAAGAFIAAIVVINLPFVPGTSYARGFTSGALGVAFLWLLSWFAWVSSGLAFRIQGTFAEDGITEALRKSPHVYDVVTSLKFGSSDVDQIVISQAGMTAVETKWRSTTPSEPQLLADADRAARAARSVRNTMARAETTGMPPELITSALVLCGPGRRGVENRRIETPLGSVDLVNADDLDRWLARRGSGVVGPDFAARLGSELHELARARDRVAVTAGPILRWLGRVR